MQQKDMQAILRRLASQANNPDSARAAQQLQQLLNAPQGQKLAQQLLSGYGDSLGSAAELVRTGDLAGAKQVLQQIMRTPEGAKLAEQLSRMMGR